MNKKGFTLIELLAVIVILGIIMTIVGVNVMGTKKKANEEEAKKIEKSITDLGANIYSYEFISGDKNTDDNSFYALYKKGNKFIVTLSELYDKGYVENLTNGKISSPFGGEGCDAYLLVNPKANENDMFKGYLDCGKNYKTTNYDDGSDLQKATLSDAA